MPEGGAVFCSAICVRFSPVATGTVRGVCCATDWIATGVVGWAAIRGACTVGRPAQLK